MKKEDFLFARRVIGSGLLKRESVSCTRRDLYCRLFVLPSFLFPLLASFFQRLGLLEGVDQLPATRGRDIYLVKFSSGVVAAVSATGELAWA